MFGFLRRLFVFFSSKNEEIDTGHIIEEQWTADFSTAKPSRIRFTITSEISFCAYVKNSRPGCGALALGFLKSNCLVWSEDPLRRYRDLMLRGNIRIDPKGGYAAAGFMFRMIDDSTCYMALVSSRGYFRFDLVRNGTPLALAGWTEAPGMSQEDKASGPVDFELEIISYGSRFILLVNGQWAAELNDSSLGEGRAAFCAALYESPQDKPEDRYFAEAELRAFSLDSRILETGAGYEAGASLARPENRMRLAETFAAMGQAGPALVQLRRARGDLQEASGELPPEKLLLGARLALALELEDEAEDYIETGLANSPSGTDSEFRDLKAGLLYSRGSYKELVLFASDPETFGDRPALYNILGHAAFNQGKYSEAAAMYGKAFELPENRNGLAAKNAASALELSGETEKAVGRYMDAGRIFLEQNRYEELGLLIPKLRSLDPSGWKTAALAGKWAFGIENWDEAESEFKKAEELRGEAGPDPAVFYLQALLLLRQNKRRAALPLLEQAVRCAPDYPLFHFKLAENRFLLDEDDPAVHTELEEALKIGREEGELFGWIHNFAARLALRRGDTGAAALHLESAAPVLGEVPELRINRALLLFENGETEKALAALEARQSEDPEGSMANCAGNLLVRAGRFEEAGEYYKKALSADPGCCRYRINRASCLAELGRYGEADEVLTAFSGEAPPEILELIAFVAAKKGEYRRAEAAAQAALEIDPAYAPALLRLGWICAVRGKANEVEKITGRLDKLELNGAALEKRNELQARLEDLVTRSVSCSICGREWRVQRSPEPAPPLKLYAVPPDDLPAGVCPGCGKVFCIGCRKNDLDENGRFTCPGCGRPLTLNDEGLKKLVNAWAEKNIS